MAAAKATENCSKNTSRTKKDGRGRSSRNCAYTAVVRPMSCQDEKEKRGEEGMALTPYKRPLLGRNSGSTHHVRQVQIQNSIRQRRINNMNIEEQRPLCASRSNITYARMQVRTCTRTPARACGHSSAIVATNRSAAQIRTPLLAPRVEHTHAARHVGDTAQPASDALCSC